MNIRKAEEKDKNQLAALFNEYRVFYRMNPDVSGAAQFILDRIENKDSKIFVCEDSHNQLIGFVQLYPIFSSTKMKKHWLLNDLYVIKRTRTKGVGKELLAKAKELAKETNAVGLLLETEKTNEIGNYLYPSIGFKLVDGSNFYEWLV